MVDASSLMTLQETYSDFLLEDESIDLRIDDTRDQASTKNYFLTKPQGILIQDSFNNFAFPVQPKPQIDDNKPNLPILIRRFREKK